MEATKDKIEKIIAARCIDVMIAKARYNCIVGVTEKSKVGTKYTEPGEFEKMELDPTTKEVTIDTIEKTTHTTVYREIYKVVK
jgi:hypothetical protein